ncbi:MAG: hypothetical protein Q8Q59_03995 [Luteolibacter sp.]|jgi:hypothetical protein|nr:hypothetical protein [Luteolibacter sp.]
MSEAAPTPSTQYARICAAALIFGSCILTAIGGEAGGDHIFPWLGTLAALTLVWLLSLRTKTISPALLLGTALAIRIAFLVMPTGYDVYRYVWEGRILLEGFNPYVHPPDDPLLTPFRDEIWKSVGHPGATAIYPPLTQWVFAAMASFGLGPFGFKVLFTLADMALCGLLCRRFGAKPALIYAWNPLAAVSFAGGGHYDSLFMLAMVLAWLSFKPEESFYVKSALWIGASIALKWMAAPLGLWLVIHQWKTQGFKRAFLTGILVALPAFITWTALSLWTGEWTLQLMPPDFSRAARSAEFIPAITDVMFQNGRIANHWFMLAMLISWLWVGLKSRTLLEAAQWGFLATYLLSPMLHAWYFVWALPFAVKSRNAGFIALAASGIAYFLVHYTLEQPGGAWTFAWWERAVIWLPFLIGFLTSWRQRQAALPSQ